MKELSRDTVALLEDIEDRIDPDTEEQFEGQWRDFLFDRFEGELFCPTRIGRSASRAVFTTISIVKMEPT